MERRGAPQSRQGAADQPVRADGPQSSDRETPTATFAELQAFRAKAIEMGLPSLATAALIGWEWLQRERDIFASFDVMHYRPKERPNAVRVLHEKTGEENLVFRCSTKTACRSTPSLCPNSMRLSASASAA